MRHHARAAVIGLLTGAILVPFGQSHAASADPTGYWRKLDAERESKIYVFKCGTGKRQLCAKITWLKNPKDSKGGPLHDVRNENPALRGREIVGLRIFNGLTRSAPSTWTGKIYNPEDGRTYSATLTVLSHKRIHLRGCKAWLLCGERQWFRTAAPPPEPAEGTEQIEASLTPGTTQAALEFATPVEPPAYVDARHGYGFLEISGAPDMAARFNGENVSSIFLMTRPIATAAVPAKAQPAATTGGSQKSAPSPAEADIEGADGLPAETAEAAAAEPVPLTRRQRRLLRKQEREQEREARESSLPWIE